MRKWQRAALTVALTAATAGGVAAAGFAANAKPAAPSHGHGPVAANVRVVETFLGDVLDGHHGDHAANYHGTISVAGLDTGDHGRQVSSPRP